MRPSQTAQKLVAPILTLLCAKIREQGFTELEVEEALSWDRKHIRQLTFGMKGLRVEEVLSILGAIGVEPRAFYSELYGMRPRADGPQAELAKLTALADSLVDLLVKNKLVNASELAKAVAARAGKDLLPEAGGSAAAETPEADAEPIDAPTAEAAHDAVTRNDLPRS